MALRITALILSVVLHGMIGNALWSRVLHERPEAYDLGDAQELFLEPQGREISEVTSVGDDLQTIETQASVAAIDRTPPPAETSRDAPDEIAENEGAPAPAAPVEAPPQDPTQAMPEEIPDVIGSEESTVPQDLVDAREPAPPEIKGDTVIAAHRATPPDDMRAPEVPVRPAEQPPPDTLDTPPEAMAAKPSTAPDEIQDANPVESGNPPRIPDEIDEADGERPVALPAPVIPLHERLPDEIELVAQPDQVVIVTEQSSGVERKGGDASVVAQYLGKINAQVQRSKVNPRSQRTGKVFVRFTIGLDGALVSREIETSSGSEVLDGAAIRTLDRAAPFPAIPPEVSTAPMTFRQGFNFIVR